MEEVVSSLQQMFLASIDLLHSPSYDLILDSVCEWVDVHKKHIE